MKTLVCLLAVSFVLLAADTSDPWPPNDLLSPPQTAELLEGAATRRPAILFVGFPVLYRSVHLPGAVMAGPCAKPEGLQALEAAVRPLPKSREILIYCGCCPFVKCPNVRPAYTALRKLGFENVKVVHLETNLHTDWVEKGYPVEKASAAP